MKSYVFPKTVKLSKSFENEASLLRKKDLQIGLAEADVATVKEGGYIILDFGKEISGGVRILTFKARTVSVRIRFGESLSECCAELGGTQNATNDHSLRDFTVQLKNYSDMSFGQTGFRFVRLDFSGEVILKSVVAESYLFNKKAKYVYEGNDKEIKKIYEVAKHTVDLCASRGYLWDGIKRDRLVWIGDIHPEMLALTTLYGRMPLIEKSLDFVKSQTPLPTWMNGYPMYSMWWIIIVADYYAYTGTEDFTKKQIPYLHGLIDLMQGCVKDNGELDYPGYFVDWPTCGKPDELPGVRAINIYAVKKAIWLLKKFGESVDEAQKLLEKLMKKPIEVQSSKQVMGLKYFAVGLSDYDKRKLTEGGARGMSTFMSYYILKAVASFDKDAAIQMMKDYYGAMLDKGATSFWEDFDMNWVNGTSRIDEFPTENEKDIHGDHGAYCYIGFRHSLCHGWSAGILRFMEEEL